MKHAHLASYRPDHTSLLVESRARSSTTQNPLLAANLGAIVIPTSKPGEDTKAKLPGLRLAAEFAAAFGCPLLVVVSQAATRERVERQLRPIAGGHLLVVDLARVSRHWLPATRTQRHWLSQLHRKNDAGAKRNLGLVFSRLIADCSTVLFLDDDIWSGPLDDLSVDGLTRALYEFGQDERLQAIGWTAEDFPDNSVAGHARRWQGHEQTTFLGGGALLTRVARTVPFFPDIYNEDWLYLIALAARTADPRAALGRAGSVSQSAYQPFGQGRAKAEEAGDVLAETLLNALSDGYRDFNLGRNFWQKALSGRQNMLAELQQNMLGCDLHHVPTYGKDPDQRLAARDALDAARRVHREISARGLATFVEAWEADLVTWQSHIGRIEKWGIAAFPATDPLIADLIRQRIPLRVDTGHRVLEPTLA